MPENSKGTHSQAGATETPTVKMSYNPIAVPVDLNDQAEILKGSEIIRVSRLTENSRDGKFVKFIYEDAKTLYQVFRRGVRESNNGPCLGWRPSFTKPYQWMQYNEALLRAQNFGAGLLTLGLQPGSKTFVGIYSHNCPEWILSEQGIYCQSMVVVPLYDTLGPEALTFIINEVNISVIIVEDDKKVDQLLSVNSKSIRNLITIKQISSQLKNRAQKLRIQMRSFEEIEKIGSNLDRDDVPPNPWDLCTISFTSGMTGLPKGVMLSHENVVSAVSAVLIQLADYKPNHTDVLLSFLPLAHMLERCFEIALYMVGGAVGFYSGDIKRITDDYKHLKPTVSPSVPRLVNRAYDSIMSTYNSTRFRKLIFKMAISSKKKQLERGIINRNSIWDRLIFKKVQEAMGGRLRLLIVGTAPLAGSVLTLMRCALSCVIIEGYGQTECTAPITLSMQGDFKSEHVGPPLPCNAVKLADVTEMDYYASRSKGEICVKGSNVFQGYFKDPQRTKDTIDANGWLHTGDVGQWLPNGTLKIIDRKKHIFKLSIGEYIVPEKIENVYCRSPYVKQVFVYGESLKSFIVGIIVPRVEEVKAWASENGIDGTLSVLCNDSRVKHLILDDIQEHGRQFGLKSFEQVKDIYLHPDPFSVQNGLLTTTNHLKRPELRRYFGPQLDDLNETIERDK